MHAKCQILDVWNNIFCNDKHRIRKNHAQKDTAKFCSKIDKEPGRDMKYHKRINKTWNRTIAKVFTYIAHFIKPYRDPTHLSTVFRQGFMKLAVTKSGKDLSVNS